MRVLLGIKDKSAHGLPRQSTVKSLQTLVKQGKIEVESSKLCRVYYKLYPLSRTFSNLSTLIFRRDFSGVPHLIDMLFLQIQQSGRIGYKYP